MSVPPDASSQQLLFGSKCQEKVGFLIPRPCRNQATVQCSVCHKPICGEHAANLTRGGLACTSCAAAENVGPGVEQRNLRDYYGYNPYPYYGYGYGWGHPLGGGFAYTDRDYDAFESSHHEAGEPQADLAESLEGS